MATEQNLIKISTEVALVTGIDVGDVPDTMIKKVIDSDMMSSLSEAQNEVMRNFALEHIKTTWVGHLLTMINNPNVVSPENYENDFIRWSHRWWRRSRYARCAAAGAIWLQDSGDF